MKKSTSVLLVASLSAALAMTTGCSSSPIASDASDMEMVETASADPATPEFSTSESDPMAATDMAATDMGAVMDSAAPTELLQEDSAPALMADASGSMNTLSDAAPVAAAPSTPSYIEESAEESASPVNLGATSAGRAH